MAETKQFNIRLPESTRAKFDWLKDQYGSYAAAFADPDYELLSVEQLIEFRQSNISVETIKTLRKKKEQEKKPTTNL